MLRCSRLASRRLLSGRASRALKDTGVKVAAVEVAPKCPVTNKMGSKTLKTCPVQTEREPQLQNQEVIFDQMNAEMELDIKDIQGDIILGFNKRYSVNLVLDFVGSKDKVKKWLEEVVSSKLSTCHTVRTHRELHRGDYTSQAACNEVFMNCAFGYAGLQMLLKGSPLEFTLKPRKSAMEPGFDATSPFVLGAWQRSTMTGDTECRGKWDFGKDRNNDMMLTFGSDNKEAAEAFIADIMKNTKGFLKQQEQTWSDRGVKGKDLFYGHEHFGFQDGLSQPEVRGKFRNPDTGKTSFIVERQLWTGGNDEETTQWRDYSRPGFRLCDTGHFLLGENYLRAITDDRDATTDPVKSNLLKIPPYPGWANNGSFVVYRKIEQRVHDLWEKMYTTAKDLAAANNIQDEATIKNLAGDIAAKVFGRWWDGTPTVMDADQMFTKDFNLPRYPPNLDDSTTEENSKKYINAVKKEAQKNGFEYTTEASWKYPDGSSKKDIEGIYHKDPNGTRCPYASHIRKVNPRDEFTDVGGKVETLRHRLLRRGNNYGTRVKDVFAATGGDDKVRRGLALNMYQADIEEQFEFVQRHWANNNSRPVGTGDDMVIGLSSKPKSITVTVNVPGVGDKTVEIATEDGVRDYTYSAGMGYFLVPSISAINDVLCWKKPTEEFKLPIPAEVKPQKETYNPPACQRDFKKPATFNMWTKFVKDQFNTAIWALTEDTIEHAGDNLYPPHGIAYRLPDPAKIAYDFDDLSKKTPLQFRSTNDILRMAKALNETPVSKVIAWTGFPKQVKTKYEETMTNMYEVSDLITTNDPRYSTTYNTRGYQDEYCEWFKHTDKNGKITRVDFTNESPEYWTFLAETEPDTALALYRKYISKDVKKQDLYILKEEKVSQEGDAAPKTKKVWRYNIFNKWNTTHGAMHLNQPNNSLAAEIYIAAEAAMKWGCTSEAALESPQALIGCAQYGQPARASDPLIGASVNALVRQDMIVSIEDPVGLYFKDFDTSGWSKPDGTPFTKKEIEKIVHYERGTRSKTPLDPSKPSQNLRVRVEVPASMGFKLGDCTIGGVPIKYAGQIAEASVTVYLNGLAINGKELLEDTEVVLCKEQWRQENKNGEGGVGPQLPSDYMPLYPPSPSEPKASSA
eukprot:TRINITY_DN1393_c2_g1_i1.p1 TRINITY_DN1393_c2_g1~~TRINITY_DN1393_c2_g1_i1.p1  ORF type:complete len:1133 (+),score=282.65 TRINITY_DN1393_c2_g1_i1:45-3443(+)